MESFAEHFANPGKGRLLEATYWLFSGAALLFVFSNQEFYLPLRLLLVLVILSIALASTRAINNILIPKLLFRGRLIQFVYGLVGLFCLSLWLILLTLIFVLFLGFSEKPDLNIPSHHEVLILIFSSYLIIAFASVTHFIKESQKHYLDKINFEKQKQRAELELKSAQRQLLQSQIHPHFIYNILNSIYALTSEDNPKVRKLILDLSSMLDYMLYECRSEKVKLSREIQFLEDYISLEKIRFGEDLQINIEKDLAYRDCMIAPLLLFPFMENAFKHGKRRAGKNGISIKLFLRNKQLSFSVFNEKGTGSTNIRGEESCGIGLQNIRDRLRLLYTERYDLEIEDGGEHFSITLKINLDEDEITESQLPNN